MNRKINVIGLDIGSSKIAAVAAGVDRDGGIEITAQVTGESGGVDKGMIVDLNASIDSVSKVFKKLRPKIQNKPGEIYVNISGRDVRGSRSIGMIPISLRGREVGRPDIQKSIDAASTIHLPFDREIIHKIVHSFSIDDQPWIKNPFGLYASRLACEVYVITANVNHIQSIYKCVNDAGYDVKDIAFTSIANSESLLDSAERESGTVLVDMGSSLTEVSVFLDGALDNFEVVDLGGAEIGENYRSSEHIKELASKISAKLQDLSRRNVKTPSVVLTGGFSLADGIIEYLEEMLSHPVKIGSLKRVQGDISGLESVKLATAIGLCGYAYEKKGSMRRSSVNRIRAKIAEIFNNYF